MDTKWKKSKCTAAFLCFILGVSLLLFSGVLVLMVAYRGNWSELTDTLKGSYQDTSEFQTQFSYELAYLMEASLYPEAAAAHSNLAGQNLLFRVVRNGQEVCSNSAWMDSPEDLPEGYNFLLYFDGKTVTIWKDGKELDIYGDGYYRPEKGDWYLPGYRNLTAEDFYLPYNYHDDPASASSAPSAGVPFQGVRICMAAAQDPVYYPGSGRNPLYNIVQRQQGNRIYLAVYASFPAAGLALFIIYLILRKAKAQADRGIAWVCGKIWLEIKLLLLIPLGFISYHAFLECFRYQAYPNLFVFLLPCLWCWYLYVNDLRYNGMKFFYNSFCAACVRFFRTKGLKYPLQERLTRWANWQFAATLPFIAASVVLWMIIPIIFGLRWYRAEETTVFWLLLGVAGLALVAVLVFFLRRQRANITALGLLLDRIQAVHDGRLEAAAPLPEDADLRQAADILDDIEAGMKAAVAEQTRSERMKVELIANVSHDLKTPLTSIISYAELLSRETGLPDHVTDYIHILNDKAVRLKSMVQEVFEVSKAASGDLPVHLEALDLAKLLRQTLADMDEAISGSPLAFRVQLPNHPVFIRTDGDRLYRVFQNLIQNALQYSLEGSRVFLSLCLEDGNAVVRTQNTSRDELPKGVDFTARFVRGDESRTDGGSGLGLSIARTFTEACGGSFQIDVVADLFAAVVTFPLTDQRPAEVDPCPHGDEPPQA